MFWISFSTLLLFPNIELVTPIFVSSFSDFFIKSFFNNVSFTAWYTDLNILDSSENLTSNFAGCTFTSTFDGSISIFNIENAYLPIVSNPLNPFSIAPDKVLSFTYLLFTKNSWFDLFDLAISGFPITPVMWISSYV